MRPIDAEPIEQALFKLADKSLAKNPYENARVCAFRRAFELILNTPTIAPPPNDPLTLEELREMDGEPVWVVNSPTKREEGFFDEWALVSVRRKNAESVGTIYHFENYGDYWLAYRRKPEEVTTQ